MGTRTWQLVAVALGIAVVAQWRLGRAPARAAPGDRADAVPTAAHARGAIPSTIVGGARPAHEPDGDWTEGDGDDQPPPPRQHWLVTFFQPRAGESLLEYRDRVLPVVQAAAAPYRRRAREAFDQFAADAGLDADGRRAVTEAVDRRAEAIKDRIMHGVLTGELLPPNVKPASGVAFARDVLDELDGAHRDVVALLDDDQLELLAHSRFDVVEYLVLTTRWEDLLGVSE